MSTLLETPQRAKSTPPTASRARLFTLDGWREVRPFLIAWIICLLCLQLVSTLNPTTIVSLDFRSFYAAGYLLRNDAAHLYDLEQENLIQKDLVSRGEVALPYYHPSYEALIYAPFSLLRYSAAYLAFQCFNLIIIFVVFFYARDLFSEVIPVWQPRPGLLFFSFLPFLFSILQGQNLALLLMLYCIAWKQIEKDKDERAGIILALALFKFQLTLPIALLIAVRRGRRFSTGFMATGAIIVALSIALIGRSASASLVRLLVSGSLSQDQGLIKQVELAIHPSKMPNINGLLYMLGTRALNAHLAFVLVSAASLGLLFWCILLARKAQRENTAFAIAILCGMLVSNHLYIHDLTLLLLPIALVGRKHPKIVFALYALPPTLFMFAGSSSFPLLSVPMLAFLFVMK
ncbi:MAG TPA: glycosyltransferase family 87 protein [Edaphobacter sp.]|jgi:hypothetical protein|nr:glycosyltransferase family 87 protein [Edaphobacter sp.]